MRDATDDVIIELLRRPDCPRARGIRPKEQAIPVLAFIWFAKTQGVATTNVELVADRFVAAVGGQRLRVVDPWSWLPNLLRRAAGNASNAPFEVWLIPTDALKRRA